MKTAKVLLIILLLCCVSSQMWNVHALVTFDKSKNCAPATTPEEHELVNAICNRGFIASVMCCTCASILVIGYFALKRSSPRIQ